MEYRGRIYKVLPIQSGKKENGSEWRRQDFIFEYFEHETDRWTDKVVLNIMNERIEQYDIHEGDEVVIGFGHNTRDFNGRYYNELRMYKFEKVNSISTPASAQTEQKAEDKESDLPF